MIHSMIEGVAFLGMKLSTCPDCGMLRVTEGERVTFIRRAALEDERVRELAPPCVPPPAHFRAPW